MNSYFSADCTTVGAGSAWSSVATEPELPVVDGTSLTLNCREDYTNKGDNTATCQNGQVVPTNEPPDCRGEHDSA